MQPHPRFGERGHQMLVSSPRCTLNCQGLSLHLPPLGEGRSTTDRCYLSPPMSASFSRPNFDDYSQGRQDDRRYQKVTPPSRPSTANKHSPGSASTLHLDKSQAKDIRGGVSTPDSSGLQSQAVARRYNESTNGEHSSNTHDSSEAQLVPGPPGIARRAKAHVPSACVNCKKKHLACETKRPCNRCTQTGKEVTRYSHF